MADIDATLVEKMFRILKGALNGSLQHFSLRSKLEWYDETTSSNIFY